MTLREILQEASSNAGIPISDRDFIRHYNKCLHDLSMLYDTAKAIRTQTIVCEDTTTEYPLIDGCIGIQRVESPQGYNITNFKVKEGNTIRFHLKGTYTVYEFILHPPITSLESVTNINTAYERAISIYIQAQAVKKTDKDTYKELMSDFVEQAGLANSNLRKVSNKYKRVAVRPFR